MQLVVVSAVTAAVAAAMTIRSHRGTVPLCYFKAMNVSVKLDIDKLGRVALC